MATCMTMTQMTSLHLVYSFLPRAGESLIITQDSWATFRDASGVSLFTIVTARAVGIQYKVEAV